jgi:hypothetical protein
MLYHVIAAQHCPFWNTLLFWKILNEYFFVFFFLLRVGPMDTELKQRKAVVGRRCTRPTGSVQPEEVRVLYMLVQLVSVL